MSNKKFLKRLLTRVGLPVLVVYITSYLTKRYNVELFPSRLVKKISPFAFIAFVILLYVAADLFKMIKVEINKEKEE
ncbi:hypothetical protein DVK85_10750 [Flavobacterium arcticum]|uniref:Uncharacterized protein n=1 Tax=Flavobacterium arcticum TaxID=1784713 RepID=A0A345HDM2_9FLAO|nr:hypothetical protein [Flavobacterium arcticum]AXG74682.1 hypothetical protein DVK85_10750 [Flavobacterium arcticum]KAF2512192.1 hypothetical protein E0W72_02915 [Flavobacterium arcticum]